MDPFEHPEIQALFRRLLLTLIAESDRGALLVGVEHVNNYLGELLDVVFPAPMGKKRRRELLQYPGAFSGFSNRIEAAYAFRLLPRVVYDSLHALRRVRNSVAHSPDEFKLAGNEEQIHRIYDLGPQLPRGIQLMAMEMMLNYKTDVMIETARELAEREPDSEPMIQTKEQAVEFMRGNPELIDTFRRQVPLWELVIAISLICSLIVHQRDKLRALLGPDQLLSRLIERAKET